jgi:hypothetical protein
MAAAQLEVPKPDDVEVDVDVQLFSAPEMMDLHRTDGKFLAAVSEVVNRAFAEFHRELLVPDFSGPGPRYFSDTQIVEELGQHGRCCIVFAYEDTEHGVRQKIPLAVASIKPYDVAYNFKALGKGGGDGPKHPDELPLSDIKDWELSAVAVKQDLKYLKRGFAKMTIKRLEDDILRRCRAATDGQKDIKLTIWVRTVKKVNNGYWARRGFMHFHEELFEAGTFQSTKPFVFETLSKEIC